MAISLESTVSSDGRTPHDFVMDGDGSKKRLTLQALQAAACPHRLRRAIIAG